MDQFTLKRPHFFFATAAQPCPYLPDRLERKIVTELSGPDAIMLHESLSSIGFRRSHAIAYTPSCPGCHACIPVRIVASAFDLEKRHRRVLRKNSDLQARAIPNRATLEQFHLFSRYQDIRHAGGDMAMMGLYDYRSMIEDSPIDTFMIEFRDASAALRAAVLVDRLEDGLSAVYSFYDPDSPQRSLGSYVILELIAEAQRQELPYLYLGYWVQESPKMRYKDAYRPLEGYVNSRWLDIDLIPKAERT